jgi:hypothetical protein
VLSRHDSDPLHRARRPPCRGRGRRRRDIDARVTGEPLARVQAKALYALEIQAGRRRGPYTDADAERYAHRASRRL